jgi:hypothetical protein
MYSALGWNASTDPSCINCQAIGVTDCTNTAGCILNSDGTACGGLLVAQGNYDNS